jgi:glycosyltransferase involved in cell wall biosynthesis
MKVLLVHNSYQQPGGEDVVVAQEAALLRRAGHEVVEYRRSNQALASLGLGGQLTLPVRLIWAHDAARELATLLRRIHPDVVHVHNTFAMISPAVYYVCQRLGIPVVQTLHNYRLHCARADFFRAGRVCEACLGKRLPWPSIVHGCYRGSRLQTAGVAAMLTVHHWWQTWETQVDVYIALTEFARQKLVQGGLPAEKIVLKPNFVSPDPGMRQEIGDYALFVGRCVPTEKIYTLLEAWQRVDAVPLKLVGSGLDVGTVRQLRQQYRLESVEFLGQRSRDEVFMLMKQARFVVFPSEWYETFGLVLVEAFACGVPVIASRLGAIEEVVDAGQTGLLFTPGDAADLAAKVRWAIDHPESLVTMGHKARQVYEAKYTATKNYTMLLDIYTRAISAARDRGRPQSVR